MDTKFKIIVETGQGMAVYPAASLKEAIGIYREQLDTYDDCQIHLLRDMPSQIAGQTTKHSEQKVEKHGKIDSKFLKQQLDGADSSNPLYGKVAVISGTFEQIGMERDEVAEGLQALGAKVNRKVSDTLDVFVQGNKPGPAKLKEVEALRASGRDIRILTPIEVREILARYGHAKL